MEQRGKRQCWALVGALAWGGCGGADSADLSGIYAVTSHTENTNACDVEGPAVTTPPYISFERQSIFGVVYYTYSSCPDATGTGCTGGGLFSLPFTELIPGGRKAEVSASSGVVPSCSLSYTVSTAILGADGALRIETRRYRETITIASDAECSSDAAKTRGTSMPCTSFEAISATLSSP